jgi:hypothetical protein
MNKKRLSLFRGGDRLFYFTILADSIWKQSGHAYEDVVAKTLAETGSKHYERLDALGVTGKIRDERSVWGYVGNAEALGIVTATGQSSVTRGRARGRYLSLTSFGEALSFFYETSVDRPEPPALLEPESVLYFKRMLEMDVIWDGSWFTKLIMSVPPDSPLKRDSITERFAIAAELQTPTGPAKYRPSTLDHKIVPRIQWMLDLRMLTSSNGTYGLTELGMRFQRLSRPWHPDFHYHSIDQTLATRKRRATHEVIWETLRENHDKLTSLYERPPNFLSIPCFRYVVCVSLFDEGYVVEDGEFDNAMLRFGESRLLDLTPAPPITARGKPIVRESERYDLFALRA